MRTIPVGERLKELRGQARLSQATLAAKVGIKQPAYARYETGEVMPSYSVLVALADYYGVSTDYLLGRTLCPQGRLFGEAGVAREARLSEALTLCFTEGSAVNEGLKELLRGVLAEL